jgi:F-type H+-transporting ATPase subunit epsilon
VPKAFECNVVTPEQSVFEGQVTYANLPAHDGQWGILHDHAPLLVQLGRGILELETEGGPTRRFSMSGGFAQMNDNRLTLLTENAAPADGGGQ